MKLQNKDVTDISTEVLNEFTRVNTINNIMYHNTSKRAGVV